MPTQDSSNLSVKFTETKDILGKMHQDRGEPTLKIDALNHIPFGSDYRYLNSLRFLNQEKIRVEQTLRNAHLSHAQLEALNENLNTIDSKLLDAKKYFKDIFDEKIFNGSSYTDYIDSIWTKYETPGRALEANDFINYLLQESADYLPVRYAPFGEANSTAAKSFPSAGIEAGRDPIEFAHLKRHRMGGGILSSDVPHQMGNTETDEAVTQSYLDLLWRQKVACVISIGGTATRLPVYRNSNGTLQTHENAKGFVLSKHDAADGLVQSRQITRIGFSTEDQKPLNLSNEDLNSLLSVYHRSQSEVVLIHCDSGVGRTGQMRLMFGLMDHYQENMAFKSLCDELLYSLIHLSRDKSHIIHLENLFFNHAKTILFSLRRFRYCVETQEQFTHSLCQTLLLIAISQQLSPQAMQTIRENCSISHSKQPIAQARICIEEMGDCESSGESSSTTPNQAGLFSPEKKSKGRLAAHSDAESNTTSGMNTPRASSDFLSNTRPNRRLLGDQTPTLPRSPKVIFVDELPSTTVSQ